MQKKLTIRRLLPTLLLLFMAQAVMAQSKLKLVLTDPATKQSSEYELESASWNVGRAGDSLRKAPTKTGLEGWATISATLGPDKRILEWASRPGRLFNGKITAANSITGKVFRELVFVDTQVHSMSVGLNTGTDRNHSVEMYLLLGPGTIIDGVPFELQKPKP